MGNYLAELSSSSAIKEFNRSSMQSHKKEVKTNYLQIQAEDILVAVAVLGLVATVSDGMADPREVNQFINSFQQEFALSKNAALRITRTALKQIKTNRHGDIIDCPCETLNKYLDLSQKMRLFDSLAEVLIVDGVVHEGEAHFLDYIAIKLNLVEALKTKFPAK